MSEQDRMRGITQQIVGDALAKGDATGWFEPLYAAAAAADGAPPWNSDAPRVLLRQWAEARGVAGAGRRAIVVGCGLGADAEYVASLGFATTAFDVSPTAIRLAHEHHPGTAVDYRVADLFALPDAWPRAFDLVVECWTVQALPDPPRGQAIEAIAGLVAPGGTLVVVAHGRAEEGPDDPDGGPPWPLPRSTIESFATGGVRLVEALLVDDAESRGGLGWRAELHRPLPAVGHGHDSTTDRSVEGV